jgi:hypothetical protein
MAKDTADSDGIDPDDPAALEAVARRLEAALDRIVRHLDDPRGGTASAKLPAEVTARLDKLITRLRDALGSPAQE